MTTLKGSDWEPFSDAPAVVRSMATGRFAASLHACGDSAPTYLHPLLLQKCQVEPFSDGSEPSCSATQHEQCHNQQYQALQQWSDTVPLHSLQSYGPSMAAYYPSKIGPATAAAACTAALAEILDSFGGPSISDGWNRLAQSCCSPSTAVSSNSAHSLFATSHQSTADDSQCFDQHSKQAMQDFLPDHHSAVINPSVDAFGYAQHAVQPANKFLPIFDQPPSYRLPSALPIWNLDVQPCADANNSDWHDAAAWPHCQHASVQTLHGSQWHHSKQELPLPPVWPLPLPFEVPILGVQLATHSLTTASAAASAASAAGSVPVGTAASDDSKPKKKKGIALLFCALLAFVNVAPSLACSLFLEAY